MEWTCLQTPHPSIPGSMQGLEKNLPTEGGRRALVKFRKSLGAADYFGAGRGRELCAGCQGPSSAHNGRHPPPAAGACVNSLRQTGNHDWATGRPGLWASEGPALPHRTRYRVLPSQRQRLGIESPSARARQHVPTGAGLGHPGACLQGSPCQAPILAPGQGAP